MLDGIFVDALLRHFGDEQVHLGVCREGSRVVAMCLVPPRHLGIWSTFLPAQAQIGPALLGPGSDTRALPGQPVQRLPHALTMIISLAGSFDDYWAQRPRKLIQNMRRYQRRAQAREPRLGVLSEPTTVAAAVDRYAALESSSWSGREGTAVRPASPQGRFYDEVMTRFAARGEALVYELWLDDELVASRLLLRGEMAVMLKTAFNEQFDRLAPGRLLLSTLQDLFRRAPGGCVEFYTNAEAARALLQRHEQRYVEFGADWFGMLTDTGLAGAHRCACTCCRARAGRRQHRRPGASAGRRTGQFLHHAMCAAAGGRTGVRGPAAATARAAARPCRHRGLPPLAHGPAVTGVCAAAPRAAPGRAAAL